MDAEGPTPRQLGVAGAILFAGLLLGMFLSATFRWQPYFWEWLAYHNGLVAAVLIYVLLSDVGRPAPRAVPPPLILPRDPPAPPDDLEAILSIGWE